MILKQTTQHILMVRPSNFGYNKETATNNAFQIQDNSLSPSQIQQSAKTEFDNFVALLKAAGVLVTVIEDSLSPPKTDAVFPNNWISFHQEGLVITYPMFAPTRRHERRQDIIEELNKTFHIHENISFAHYENQNRFLEGTGSMILDRVHKIVYACRSLRTDELILDDFCKKMNYKKVLFDAVDENGVLIYHTNVMMALGENFVIICLEAIKDKTERQNTIAQLEATNKEIIPITLKQMSSFAGNMLQVTNKQGDAFLVMSQQAYQSLDPTTQIAKLHNYTSILYSPLDTIEKYGGGSARCMMAEIFLPLKTPLVEHKEKRGRGRKPSEPVKTIIEKYVEGKGWVRVQ